jgi:hypothetical protein
MALNVQDAKMLHFLCFRCELRRTAKRRGAYMTAWLQVPRQAHRILIKFANIEEGHHCDAVNGVARVVNCEKRLCFSGTDILGIPYQTLSAAQQNKTTSFSASNPYKHA